MDDLQNIEKLWADASTLEEIGELTAQWVKGKISCYPLYGESIDDETISIRDDIAFFNRNGFVTTFSQPGEPLEDGCAQRAAVAGFASEKIAKKIGSLSLHTNLLTFIFPPGVTWGYHTPITIQDYQPCTWCGSTSTDEIDQYVHWVSDKFAMALGQAWKVIIIDPTWGREKYLWENVREVLTKESVKPYNIMPYDAGLDFVF